MQDEGLQLIQQKIDQGLIEEANFLIEQELAAPYIPPVILKQLNQLKQQVKELLPIRKSSLSFVDVIDAIKKNNQIEYLLALEQFNLALYPDDIQSLFDSINDPMARGLLIEICVSQRVVDSFTITKDGMLIEFVPMSVVAIANQDGVLAAQKYFADWFEQNPSLQSLCQDTLMKVALANLPFNYETEEAEILAHSITRYVYMALQQAQDWQKHKSLFNINEDNCIEITV